FSCVAGRQPGRAPSRRPPAQRLGGGRCLPGGVGPTTAARTVAERLSTQGTRPLGQGRAGDGYLAGTGRAVATDQGRPAPGDAGRRTQHTGAGGGGPGPDVAPVTGRRFRQAQAHAATTPDAELSGRGAA